MNKGLMIVSFVLMAVLLFAGLTIAMESNNFAIKWDVLGGSGGGVVESASYSVDGTAGQTIVGFSNGDTYQMGAGYWFGKAPSSNNSTVRYIHLPLIHKSSPPATPAPFPELANGAFDAGITGWSQSSSEELPLIVHEDDLIEGVSPHSHPWLAWLGGRNGEIADLSQSFTIPAEYSDLKLHFYYLIGAQETTCRNDLVWVRVNDDALWSECLYDDHNTNGWRTLQLDLGSYAGQTVTLHFQIDLNDDDQNSNWFIDTVTLCDDSSSLHPCP